LDKAILALIELQQTTGMKRKLAIVEENRDNEHFTRLLYYACNPRLSYKVSEATLRRLIPAAWHTHQYRDIFDVCNELSKRKALDDETTFRVCSFLRTQNAGTQELYIKLLAKTLRLGITAKSINKVIPGLIPEWEVQQAYPIEKYPLKDGCWFSVSQKLNGVRATFYRGELIGRSGIAFDGLEHITDELSHFPHLVFDGELTLANKGTLSDNEAFRLTTGIVNSENDDKTVICFTIFDMLPADEFDTGESVATYKERRQQLDDLQEWFTGNDHIHILNSLYSGDDQSIVPKLLEKMVSEDKEGLMINLDVPYQCKRHRGILKVKQFYTMDLPILRCESGSGKLANTLGAIIVDYKGNEVGVGSGFTDEQRSWIWTHQDELVGSLVEIKYKEQSYDKSTGCCSLQFPVFVSLRTDKQDVSFG